MVYWFPRMNEQYWLNAGAEAAETSSSVNDKKEVEEEADWCSSSICVFLRQRVTWIYSLLSHLHFALVTNGTNYW